MRVTAAVLTLGDLRICMCAQEGRRLEGTSGAVLKTVASNHRVSFRSHMGLQAQSVSMRYCSDI